MENKYNPKNIQEVLAKKQYPTAVMWNRLESRPRTHHFDRALKAEVRDALWMLSKQWQMGEFKGDDAGSPVFAKVHLTSSHLDKYKAADQAAQNLEANIPLEVKAEQKKIPFVRDGKEISIDIRLQMGKYWLALLKREGLGMASQYIKGYRFEMPTMDRSTDYIFAHREVWQQYSAINGRSMDGFKFYQHLVAGKDASENIVCATVEGIILERIGKVFKTWFESMYQQPHDEKDNAWLADRLEYQFSCSAESEKEVKTLSAKEYNQGHLDWYSFDIDQRNGGNPTKTKDIRTGTLIPSHVEFDGMPDTRWWKFEDGRTNLGDVKPSTTDLSKLLLIEFGLVFANDWFLIPYTLPIGSLSNIEGLTVRNNFGEITWINATEEESAGDLPWSMFKLHSDQQNNTLFLAPSALKVHEGNPLEEILFVRDEMSNMVWGMESVVPTIMGSGEKGGEMALRTRQFHEKIVHENTNTRDLEYAAKVSYLAMTDVPENWIPFIPVHIKGDNRETQLQRSSMLRIIEGDDPLALPVKIKPQSSILREGLEHLSGDGTPDPLAYYIHEEEVPRSGIRVSQSFQRTRWTNGEVFIWLGMKKKTGRGEGSSGLAFDQLRHVE